MAVVQEYSPAVHSNTPFGFSLGPDLPWEDDPSPGTLRFSADKILTCLFVTHTGIRTSHTSSCSYRSTFSGLGNAPLPDTPSCESAASVNSLAPIIYGATPLDQ
jgi:hypothetical protein